MTDFAPGSAPLSLGVPHCHPVRKSRRDLIAQKELPLQFADGSFRARTAEVECCPKPKFLTGSDGILLIRRGIIQSSVSNYWQQGEQRIGLGLQRGRLWHLLKAWDGFFRFQPVGHACSTG